MGTDISIISLTKPLPAELQCPAVGRPGGSKTVSVSHLGHLSDQAQLLRPSIGCPGGSKLLIRIDGPHSALGKRSKN